MKKNTAPTQKQMIMAHLREFKHLDAWTAFIEYGIMTGLRSRISELRAEGNNIETRFIDGKSKITGRRWAIADYWYHE